MNIKRAPRGRPPGYTIEQKAEVLKIATDNPGITARAICDKMQDGPTIKTIDRILREATQ